jgi:PAS domain S-box-containing protein
MNKSYRTGRQLLDEAQELAPPMMEAEETLRAILSGQVDGLVVSTAEGDQVFTLSGADHPYRVMVETMNEGAVTLASDGTILFCNQRFADIVKGSLEKVIGSSITQYISSTDIQLFEVLLEQGLKGSSKVELALQTGGENSVPVFLSISALQDTDMPGALCMVVTDLAEQKRNEEILAEEKLTTQILHQAAEIFVLCDHQGRIIRASQSTNSLFGRSPVFQAFDEAFHLLYPDGTPFVLLSAIGDNGLHAVEVTLKHGDDKFFSFLLSANALTTHKDVIGIVVVMVDITERMRIEKELQKAYDGLEERVAERTAQLVELNTLLQQEITKRAIIEERLKESQERLRNLAKHLQKIRENERTSLSRELHDELGQVLTAIKMDVRWIGKRLPEENDLLLERANSLLALIDSAILSVQRLSTELRPGALDDFGLADAITLTAKEFAKRTRMTCEVISEPQCIVLKKEISTGAFRIFQEALTNIARHAGAQRVIVRLQKNRNTLTMEVRDDGRGITRNEITDPKSIGLTGMRERAYAMGGTLTALGIREKGTTITLSVPLHEGNGRNGESTKRNRRKQPEEVQ